MSSAESFKKAVTNLQEYADAAYMSDPKNWCVVHATKYMPRKNKDGHLYIPSTAMATDFEIPRTTVHTTFNHIVSVVLGGNWDNTPIVVLAPYNDLVKENGNPAEIAVVDTYWATNPNRGLVLPDSTYIVKPSNDVLFSIGEHGATYKRDNYTDEEIKTILEMLPEEEREKFEKYQNGDFEDYEIEHEFDVDTRVKKMYESARDKRAFLRGLFEESRFDILSQYLRNTVVRMAMEKNGFREAISRHEGGLLNNSVRDTALNMGINANSGGKGHSTSLYGRMEDFWNEIKWCFYSGFGDYGVINSPDLKHLFNYITSHKNDKIVQEIVKSILEDKRLDFMNLYEQGFSHEIQGLISDTDRYIEERNNELVNISKSSVFSDQEKEQLTQEILQKQSEDQKYIKTMSNLKNISDYDANLAAVFQQNSLHLSKEYENWRTNLKRQPGYEKFINDLKKEWASIISKKQININIDNARD